MTKEKRDRKRYETFKLKWMAAHGYSLIDLVSKINDCYEKLQAKVVFTIKQVLIFGMH